MPAKVVDASALGALLFGEPDAETIASRLGEAELIAPALLDFEITNVCLKKLRRHRHQRDSILAAFALYGSMSIKVVEVDFDAALELADQQVLTAYDASYLWLARDRDMELVTLDKKLGEAAVAVGLRTA